MGEEGMVNMAVQEFTKVRMKKAEKEERERELRALSDTGGPSGTRSSRSVMCAVPTSVVLTMIAV